MWRGPVLASLIHTQGMEVPGDALPECGHVYHSDEVPFATEGSPSVAIGAGEEYIGKPKDFGEKADRDYNAHRYHQPADAYSPDFDLSGAAQISNIVLKFARTLANSPVSWNRT